MWSPRRRALTCRRAVGLVTDYLDGAMSDADLARFERHLAECPDCVEYVEQIRALAAAAGEVRPDDLAPEALDELVGLYRTWRES